MNAGKPQPRINANERDWDLIPLSPLNLHIPFFFFC
jgi:hypothetical protein